VFYFNPWVIQDLDELWAEFGKSLFEALEEANLVVESSLKSNTRHAADLLDSTGIGGFLEGAAGIFGKDKMYKGTFALVGKWLKPDGPQIKKIREKLKDRRVIVFIDDLDRATPGLLPKLLLSLREILDLPSFTFVLAFDDEIVAEGLVTSNKAWGDGASFLEKILDFRYFLPKVSKARKRSLLRNMRDQYCPFVPEVSIEPIEFLLPDNPRKLKILIRGMVSLKPQLARHNANELNWVEIWLAEMIRQESYPFFLRVLEGDNLDQLVGVGFGVRQADPDRNDSGEESEDDSDITAIIDEVGGISKKQTNRLIELIKATRTLGGHRLLYNWKFALRPEAITWKEFEELSEKWKFEPAANTISTWITENSAANSMNLADTQQDLFDALLNAMYDAGSSAAQARTLEDNSLYCAKAERVLEMIGQFLKLPKMLTVERFGKLFEKSLHWIAFRVNPSDARLRRVERELLHDLSGSTSDSEAPAMLEELKPWDEWAFSPDIQGEKKYKEELRDGCVALLTPKVQRAFIDYLKRPESIRLLSSDQGSQSFLYILFGPDRLPWPKDIRDAILDVFQNAKLDMDQYEKTNDFLKILVETVRNRSSYLGRDSAALIVADAEFIKSLWSAATSRSIQFRMLASCLAARGVLVELGAQEGDLPLSPELEAANQR
jgi:hypothetical protein